MLVNWIRVKSRRQSQQQIAWYQEFHSGTRYYTAYGDQESDREEPSLPQLTWEVAGPGLRTAAVGGGDRIDPDDYPRRGPRWDNSDDSGRIPQVGVGHLHDVQLD